MKKANRLTNDASFNYIYKRGTVLNSSALVVIFVAATSTKVGISVSKKVGNSVTRNLVKRRIREAVGALLPAINGNYNYVIVARQGAAAVDFQQICKVLQGLLKKAGHI